jgi:predicted component of type VI protein secretion system
MMRVMKRILMLLVACGGLLCVGCASTKADSPLGRAVDRVIDEISAEHLPAAAGTSVAKAHTSKS